MPTKGLQNQALFPYFKRNSPKVPAGFSARKTRSGRFTSKRCASSGSKWLFTRRNASSVTGQSPGPLKNHVPLPANPV